MSRTTTAPARPDVRPGVRVRPNVVVAVLALGGITVSPMPSALVQFTRDELELLGAPVPVSSRPAETAPPAIDLCGLAPLRCQ
ncbi:hypothetical protein [Lentzea sp. NPDC004782]|uniref:hypothetical protein n=1 Tax=Lentzea sp. NPDC004782 TaxID=3154458 RepID=UPI0033B9FF40